MKIAKETTEELSQKALEKEVVVNVEGEDSVVVANYRQVFEMIFNICDNAIKYNTEKGEVNIKIAHKTIEISDTGIGIPEEYLERIFERFFRVDKSHSKKVNGTGLGLSITKHLAILNNAEIEVKSKLSKGTTFKIFFKEQA